MSRTVTIVLFLAAAPAVAALQPPAWDRPADLAAAAATNMTYQAFDVFAGTQDQPPDAADLNPHGTALLDELSGMSFVTSGGNHSSVGDRRADRRSVCRGLRNTRTRDGRPAHCPVMTDQPVGGDDIAVTYNGLTVRLCCELCATRWDKIPDAYARREVLPQLETAGKRTLTQTFCPVNTSRVVTEDDPFIMHDGMKIHVFNRAAARAFEADPSRYLDSTVLPQMNRDAR